MGQTVASFIVGVGGGGHGFCVDANEWGDAGEAPYFVVAKTGATVFLVGALAAGAHEVEVVLQGAAVVVLHFHTLI